MGMSQESGQLAQDNFGEVVAVHKGDSLADVARVGTVLELTPGLEELEWFGSGPHETYPDRARGGIIGRWRSTVTEQYVPYIRPQENGGHAGVRWLRLTGPSPTSIPSRASVTSRSAISASVPP